MKRFIKYLQNPLVKIFISPFSIFAFGTIVGSVLSGRLNWWSMILLYVIAISSQLLEHFNFQKYSVNNRKATPTFLLVIGEGMLALSVVAFMLKHSLAINLLLLLYVFYIHILYRPYDFSLSIYHFLLDLFYKGVVLNCVAYYSQAYTITPKFLMALLPILLLSLAIAIQENIIKRRMIKAPISKLLRNSQKMSLLLAFISIALAFYLSLPTQVFFVFQVLFVLIAVLLILPFGVKTNYERQMQNKLNFFSVVSLLYSVVYAISYLY